MNWTSTMSAAAFRSEHQRAFGDLRVAFKRRGLATVLDDLRQEGCLKARFPRPSDWPEAVLLNTSGGVAGGDRLSLDLELREGASATFTTQAAERYYRALDDDAPARVATKLRIAENGAAEWLPQESILFDRCAINRTLAVDAAANARFLGVETLLFGRQSSGEHIATARIADTITIRRAGKLILHDAVRANGPIADLLSRPAIANGGSAIATLIHLAPDAESHLESLRAAWNDTAAETGASAWNGLLIGRIVATSGAQLRAAIIAGLTPLRAGRPLPRVWQC